MKAKNSVPKKGGLPNPPPGKNTSSTELPEGTLSKDELIDLLEQTRKECVHLSGDALNQPLPVLLFLEQALDQDEPMDLVVHLKDRDVNYSHDGAAVAQILRWISADLFEAWNKIDKSDIGIAREIRRCRTYHPKAASSR